MDSNEGELEAIASQLKLPVDKRKKFNKEGCTNLIKVSDLLRAVTQEVKSKDQTLRNEFIRHVLSEEIHKSFYNWDISSLSLEHQAAVREKRTIIFSCKAGPDGRLSKKDEFQQWAPTALVKDAEDAQKLLGNTHLHISTSNVPTVNNRSESLSQINKILDYLRSVEAEISTGAAFRIFTRLLMEQVSKNAREYK